MNAISMGTVANRCSIRLRSKVTTRSMMKLGMVSAATTRAAQPARRNCVPFGMSMPVDRSTAAGVA